VYGEKCVVASIVRRWVRKFKQEVEKRVCVTKRGRWGQWLQQDGIHKLVKRWQKWSWRRL